MAQGDVQMPEERAAAMVWVGIGASAGGLEALRTLARALPAATGATYVVVQHMAPLHRSLLSELIGRETRLPVAEVTDGLVPAPDRIYVTPPNHDVVVRDGRLHLSSPSQEPGAPKPSIDRFFRSLAEEVETRAIGVILSGTGSDGAYGIRAIRAAGGITIAQDRGSAEYDGMPGAAVDTGCVDLVLDPARIGAEFGRILQQPRDLEPLRRGPAEGDAISALLHAIYAQSRVDFRDYKAATVQRRIERRMTALGLTSIEDYVARTRATPEELDELFRDLLISVTSFFRDPEEFEALGGALRGWLADNPGQPVRVWIPGCATGEEAYTIAILYAEAMGGLEAIASSALQIFATDIDEPAIAVARRGIYPAPALRQMPQALVERYFQRTLDGYAVSKALRDRVVFSTHNLCQDPPFLNIDLVSCRNLMIYFKPALQERVLSRLHYALNLNGLLFLGRSESVTGSEELFRQLGSDRRIFRRRVSMDRGARGFLGPNRADLRRRPAGGRSDAEAEALGAMFDSLVRAVGPNAILVTSDLHIKRVHGDINPYLHVAPGAVRMTTSSLLRDSFRHEARSLLIAAERRREARMGVVRRVEGSPGRRVQLRAYPLDTPRSDEKLSLLVFAEWEEDILDTDPARSPVATEVAELERELATTRESLQQTVEELETSNEELQALNEELQSSNEELQSTNEELETANEELQSTNEELTTVNEELQINALELTNINQELDSILANIAAPVLVVDRSLTIVRCSQRARERFRVTPGIVRPHISQTVLPEGFPSLSALLDRVIRTGARAEAQSRGTETPVRLVAAPYFNPRGDLIGATLIVSDLSARAQEDVAALLDALPVMLLLKDDHGQVLQMNAALADLSGLSREDLPGLSGAAVFGTDAEAEYEDDLRVIARNRPLAVAERALALGRAERRLYRVAKRPQAGAEHGRGVFVALTDISETSLASLETLLDERLRGQTGATGWHWVPDDDRLSWTAPGEAAALLGISAEHLPEDLGALAALMEPEGRTALAAVRAGLAAGSEAAAELGLTSGGGIGLSALPSIDGRGRVWRAVGRLWPISGAASENRDAAPALR